MRTRNLEATAFVPHKAAEIALHTGDEVFTLLADETFKTEWDVLYRVCPWATVFQSRAFVATWYQVYRTKYLPILVTYREGGKMVGLLAMAVKTSGGDASSIRHKKGRIIGAGHFEAEYQCWLAVESEGEFFIKAALAELRKQFPKHIIQFRYIPPQAPLSWVDTDSKWRSQCVLQIFKRPLMEMRDPDLSKKFRKTEYRNKLNRLKRLGTLSFERLNDPQQFASMLDELAVQYDFRQGAMFNKNHFREEPLKADFLQALFEQGLLHVTVLKVNEKIQAAIVAVAGKDWVHLGGINIHSPFHAKFYSPGFVHFIMLGQKLLQEGVAVFDLTPGGDFYKERMATRHDHVYEVIISGSLIYRTKRKIRKQIHYRMIKAGIWPMGAEVSLRKKIYEVKGWIKMIKRQGLVSSTKDLWKGGLRRNADKVYLAINKPVITTPAIEVRENSLGDLLLYEARSAWMTRWAFLQSAMRRLEVGEHCYTWCGEDRLLGCAWLGNGVKEVPQLQAFYCHPAGRERYGAFVAAVTAAVTRSAVQQVQVVVPAQDKTTLRHLQAIGFHRMES